MAPLSGKTWYMTQKWFMFVFLKWRRLNSSQNFVLSERLAIYSKTSRKKNAMLYLHYLFVWTLLISSWIWDIFYLWYFTPVKQDFYLNKFKLQSKPKQHVIVFDVVW